MRWTGCFTMVALSMACSLHADDWTAWRNSLVPKGAPGPELTLATEGAAAYHIVVPAHAATAERKAAEDLAQWLEAMTGAKFPIVNDAEPSAANEIAIGNTNRLTSVPLPVTPAELGAEGYVIGVQGQTLYLLGGHGRGIVNAVYALLEEDLGCRWYAGESSRIPKRPTLTFQPIPRHFTPALEIRDPFYAAAFNGVWSLRNRTNAPSAAVPAEWGGHVDYALFVHTFNELVPPNTYFAEHPEYFMLDENGKRSTQQLCTTNPDTIRIATESVLRILGEKPECEIVSVSKNDGGRTCLCERCKALDDAEGTNAAALLYMVNQVAEAVEKEHPDVVVSTLAYLETVKPPKTMRPRKNVAICLCTDNCMWTHPFTPAREIQAFHDAMTGWGAIHNRIHIWDYCVNFSHYTAPMPNMDAIADNIRFFMDNHATGIMEQGAYQSSGAERDLLRSWVFAKLLWDPSLDVTELTQDFIWGYFEEAAPAIAEYNALLRNAGKGCEAAMADPEGGIRYAMDHPFLSPEFLAKADELYNRAEQLAENGEIQQRVQRDRLPILYVKLSRGPEFTGDTYGTTIDQFEKTARQVGLTHIYEGPPDLEKKLETWREAWAKYAPVR
ncbi:MAG: hypothetical protein QG656_2331 [Candidatus Hydrogenedentes bacterium]|nr:hypothetical protein [Candidatus Hydrogenedentota bacterium]